MKFFKFYRLIISFLVLLISTGICAEEEYVLGSGDIVRISVYGHADLDSVARINELGRITFPLIGDIKIGEQPVNKAEAIITKALIKGGFVRAPQVSIIIDQYRSRQVSVLGEVNKPGKYSIEGVTSIIDLVALAGGVTASAAEVIRLIDAKEGNKKQTIDLYNILHNGDISENINVDNGDIVFIPTMERFYIYGEVQRPGVYRLERNMILMQALAVGGGVTSRGTERGIKIKRENSRGKVVEISAGLTDQLKPNDVVYVKESLF